MDPVPFIRETVAVSKLIHHIFARCHDYDYDHVIFVHGLKKPVNSDGSPTERKHSRAPIRGYKLGQLCTVERDGLPDIGQSHSHAKEQ